MNTKTFYILMEKTEDGTWSNAIKLLDNSDCECVGRQWVSDIVVPEWITKEDVQKEVEENSVGFVGFSSKYSDILSNRQWSEDLYEMYQENRDYVLGIINLLSARNPNKFFNSLKSQVIDWLNTPSEQRKHDYPLSFRQYLALTNRR